MKKVLFSLCIFTPLICLIILLISFSWQIYQIKKVDYRQISRELKDYLEKDKGKITVKLKDNYLFIDYADYLGGEIDKTRKRNFPYENRPESSVIHIYGSSPIISRPFFFRGDFPFFSAVLSEQLKERKIKVYNFGMSSFDSSDIKELIEKTVALDKPELIIFYDCSGSDFENAYFTNIKRRFSLLCPFLKNIIKINRLADWFYKSQIEPNLINLLQKITLLNIQREPFEEYNELIFSAYKKGIHDIIRVAQVNNLPLLILPSICNLEAQPFGIQGVADSDYKLGIKEKDYSRKIASLMKARDLDIFTIDVGGPRAAIHDFLADINETGVYVLDLQKELEKEKFPFNHKYFYDIGHMRPALHKIIAEYLYAFITENELINP
ncbi:MAG: hypothetical protein AB1481_05555 [Candidatus Omnitrophota bacterium]